MAGKEECFKIKIRHLASYVPVVRGFSIYSNVCWPGSVLLVFDDSASSLIELLICPCLEMLFGLS